MTLRFCQNEVDIDPVLVQNALDDRLIRIVERDLTDLAQKQVFYSAVDPTLAENALGRACEEASVKLHAAYKALAALAQALKETA